jgi:hypothetical protein
LNAVVEGLGLQDVEYVNTIQTMERRNYDVLYGVKAKGVRGFGVKLNHKGELQVIGDDWMQKVSLRQFQNLIQENYTRIAVATSLKAMGYNTQMHKNRNGALLIMGVQH